MRGRFPSNLPASKNSHSYRLYDRADAIEQARAKAAKAQVSITFVAADVSNFGENLPPFDFVFDRGCYHCCRRENVSGYLATLRNVSRPGTRLLVHCGNAGEVSDSGIPRVTEEEIRSELGAELQILQLREFHFEEADGSQGPLGWSVLLVRN